MGIIRGEVVSRHDEPSRSAPRRKAPDAGFRAYLAAKERIWGAICGDPGHLTDTPFRRANKWPAVDECVLRDRARRQLAERAVTP